MLIWIATPWLVHAIPACCQFVIFLIADFSHNSVTPHIFTDSKYNDDAKRDNVMMVYSKSYAHSNRNKVSAHDSGLIGNVCFFLSPTKSPLQVLILASYEDDVGKRDLVMMAYSRSYACLKISKKSWVLWGTLVWHHMVRRVQKLKIVGLNSWMKIYLENPKVCSIVPSVVLL